MSFREQAKAAYQESKISEKQQDLKNAKRYAEDEADIIRRSFAKDAPEAYDAAVLSNQASIGSTRQGDRLRGAFVIGLGEEAVKLTFTGAKERLEALALICPACDEQLLFPLSSFRMEEIGRVLSWEDADSPNHPPNPHPQACPALLKTQTGVEPKPDDELEEALLGFVRGFSYFLTMADALEQKRQK